MTPILEMFQQDWTRDAACRGRDPEPFHPRRTTSRRAVRAAKAVCHTCPVAAECLQDALLRREEFGIWGGLDEDERRPLMGLKRKRA